jgi:ribonuclease D
VTEWVRTPAEMAALSARLGSCRSLALDTESDSLHHHFEKVCLVQVAADSGEGWLVDPLSVRDLSAFGPLLADPGIAKVLHGADYDVTTLKRDFGFSFAGLFDTMIAARFLSLPEVGLQAVAAAELGVHLSKDSQRDDWSRRPLSPRQEAYALADVEHLLALRDRLEAKLSALGRLGWVLEECEAVAALPPARRGRDPEAYLRIKGASRLPPRGLLALAELYLWRDSLAAATDVPAFKILSNETLLALAEARPPTLEALGGVRGVPPRLRGDGLLQALRRAEARSPGDLPPLPRRRRPSPSEAERRKLDGLKAWRATEAKRLELDVSVVLPQRLIDRVVEEEPQDLQALSAIEGLRQWRVQEFGRTLLAALHAPPP